LLLVAYTTPVLLPLWLVPETAEKDREEATCLSLLANLSGGHFDQVDDLWVKEGDSTIPVADVYLSTIKKILD
jgi:hypothetical protein